MMGKTKSWTYEYDEIKTLGTGGNADVYLVEDKKEHKQYALKELRNRSREKKIRFINEIIVAQDNYKSIPGIIPIIKSNQEQYWYIMPIAIPVMETLDSLNITEIVKGVIQLSETLEKLHLKKIYHRDIKPSNIYLYNKRLSFGDFGLVDFPDNQDLTQSDKGLGAIFTIAPEMKRNPKQAEAGNADVYSLAKTMWMLLSGDEKGFDGVYNFLDRSHSLRHNPKYKNVHTAEIELLLKESTENDPLLRPNISQFKARLCQWIEIYKDEDRAQNSDWNFLKNEIFIDTPPSYAVWEQYNQIIKVLNIIGATPAYNHMLYPDGGGLDFSYCENATEEDCVYLYDTLGLCHIIKPKRLIFKGFEEDFGWSYFLLELEEMEPIFSKYGNISYEFLIEDYPGNYVDAKYATYKVYDYETGKKFPDGYKEVRRYFKGKFLFVLKGGPYNAINAVYDGRHAMCSNEDFGKYIEHIFKTYNLIKNMLKTNKTYENLPPKELEDLILNNNDFRENPFKKSLIMV